MGGAGGGSAGDLFGPGEADGGLGEGVEPAFPVKRGPGRPPGAVNRKTLAARAYYQARGFRDPLAYLGELVTGDPVALLDWMVKAHRAAGGKAKEAPTILDVVQLQRSAAAELMPFLHGKMPVRVEVDDERTPVLIVDLGGGEAAAVPLGARDATMSAGQPETAENRPSEAPDETRSHGEGSHG